jgi:hypothetical protein
MTQALPALGPQQCLNPNLLDFGIFFFKFVGEVKSNDRKTRLIYLYFVDQHKTQGVRVKNITNLNIWGFDFFIVASANGSVDITDDSIISRTFECTAQQPGVLHISKADCSISFKTEMEEVEILGNDRRRWSRKVEGERIFHRTEVMEFKDEILWKVFLVSPDNPSYADVAEPKFVAS